jgi:Fe-S cluster biosynthesis and repair protein YggX
MSQRSQGRKQADNISVTSSQGGALTEVYSEIAEEDEWTAIQKFNQLLHYEEQKQSMMREQERRRLMRQELDKQLIEKANRKQQDREEEDVYVKLQQEHVKLLGMRETEKRDMARIKTQQEKESRDRQLMEEKRKRRVDEKTAFKAEIDLVDRLKKEMEAERYLQAEKRD